jgi:expansin (peptidoglycan-binding protein)
MKNWIVGILAIAVAYIDIVDSPTDKTKSYVVVGYDNGVEDRLQVERNMFSDSGNTKAISAAAMKMIKARTGK